MKFRKIAFYCSRFLLVNVPSFNETNLTSTLSQRAGDLLSFDQ